METLGDLPGMELFLTGVTVLGVRPSCLASCTKCPARRSIHFASGRRDDALHDASLPLRAVHFARPSMGTGVTLAAGYSSRGHVARRVLMHSLSLR